MGGKTTTQRAGFPPIEGDVQPLGPLAYLRPLSANRDGEMVGPQGTVFSSSEGYLHVRPPSISTPNVVRELATRKWHSENNNEGTSGRGPGVRREMASGRGWKLTTRNTACLARERAELIDASSMKPSVLGGIGEKHSPPRKSPWDFGSAGSGAPSNRVCARPYHPKRITAERYPYTISLPSLGRDIRG